MHTRTRTQACEMQTNPSVITRQTESAQTARQCYHLRWGPAVGDTDNPHVTNTRQAASSENALWKTFAGLCDGTCSTITFHQLLITYYLLLLDGKIVFPCVALHLRITYILRVRVDINPYKRIYDIANHCWR